MMVRRIHFGAGAFFSRRPVPAPLILPWGESFPLEVRASTTAVFHAFGTGIGDVAGPAIFAVLIAFGERSQIPAGYAFGGIFMIFAALVEYLIGSTRSADHSRTSRRPCRLSDR